MGSDGGRKPQEREDGGGGGWGDGGKREELGGYPHISQQGDVGEDATAQGLKDAIPMSMKAN